MARKTRDIDEFVQSVTLHNPNCVYIDRHWWGYHIWFVPSGYKYEDRLIIDGRNKLSKLMAALCELQEKKIEVITVHCG